jgi:hypothetical protein
MLPEPVEAVLREDALECARRAKRYKFGRLRNQRIVNLLRKAAADAGVPLTCSDESLIEEWFRHFDQYVAAQRGGPAAEN